MKLVAAFEKQKMFKGDAGENTKNFMEILKSYE